MRLRTRLKEWFAAHPDIRRTMQAYVLFSLREEADFPSRLFEYLYETPGLAPDLGDLKWLLATLSEADRSDPANRSDWRQMLDHWPGHLPRELDVLAIAHRFAEGDAELESVLTAMSQPSPYPKKSTRDQDDDLATETERLARFKQDRAWFAERRLRLRAGEGEEIGRAARGYMQSRPGLLIGSVQDRLVKWLGEDLASDALAGFDAVLSLADLLSPGDVSRKRAAHRVASYGGLAILIGVVQRFRQGQRLDGIPREALLVAHLLEDFLDWSGGDEEADVIHGVLQNAVETSLDTWTGWHRLMIEPQLDIGEGQVSGLYELTHGSRFREHADKLLIEWLGRYPAMSQSAAMSMVDTLLRSKRFDDVKRIATDWQSRVLPDYRAALAWISVDWVSDFERHRGALKGYGVRHPLLLSAIEDRLELGSDTLRQARLSDDQIEWLLREFCAAWPYTSYFEGDGEAKDEQKASELLNGLIDRLAASPLAGAGAAFDRLLRMPDTGYHANLRHAAAQHRQAQGEAAFRPVSPDELAALLKEGPPTTIDELQAIVLDVMDDVQERLRGSDTDMTAPFWDGDVPHNENYGRDRLADLITPYLEPYAIQRIPERDMPDNKRADLAFAHGLMQLPMEIKGQWHDDVWDAASGQLDELYLRDWRAQDRGIYVVLWFGTLPSKSGRRLKVSPEGVSPGKPDEMKTMLEARMPRHRRHAIAVRVVDLGRK